VPAGESRFTPGVRRHQKPCSVLSFDDLPIGSLVSRRALVRWSDGTEGEALRWCRDEVLVCEGDHGNSRLMSPRAEMHRAVGSVRVPRGT
jgi:hypothetical protein